MRLLFWLRSFATRGPLAISLFFLLFLNTQAPRLSYSPKQCEAVLCREREDVIVQRVSEEPAAAKRPPYILMSLRDAGVLRRVRIVAKPATLWASGIVAVAVAIRVLLSALGWPPNDGDEGTMGIWARRIQPPATKWRRLSPAHAGWIRRL
jgi:hypothetical protein